MMGNAGEDALWRIDQNIHLAYFGFPRMQRICMRISGTNMTAVRTDLSLRWTHMLEGTFSHN